MAQCPKGCGTQLQLAERSGIQIDFCPRCRGIWLDQGELERFIELAEFGGARPAAPAMPSDLLPPARMAQDQPDSRRSRRYDDDDDDDDDDYRRRDRRDGRGDRDRDSPLRAFFDIFD